MNKASVLRSFRLPESHIAKLEVLAAEHDCSVNWLVRHAIEAQYGIKIEKQTATVEQGA